MSDSGPTLRRRQLGSELRRFREAAGKRIEDVAKELETSGPRISRIENGQTNATPKQHEIRRMLAFYGVTNAEDVEAMVQLLRDSQQRGWWEPYAPSMPSGLDILVGLETGAWREQVFEIALIPGLLQTPTYARELMLAGRARHEALDDLIKLRMERQQVLTREPEPLSLWAVLDEAAVRRPVGGSDTMREQLRHLIEMGRRDNVRVQILPYSKGAHEGLNGPYTILEFRDAPTVVYVESQAGNVYVEKDRDLMWYTEAFAALSANSLDFDQSTAFLERVAEEI